MHKYEMQKIVVLYYS